MSETTKRHRTIAKRDCAHLMTELIKRFTSFPDQLKVETIDTEFGFQVLITPHADDIGKIIGGAGAMCDSLSVILHNIGKKESCEITLRIQEPVVGERQKLTWFKRDAQWSMENIMPVLREMCAMMFIYPHGFEWKSVSRDMTRIELSVHEDEELAVPIRILARHADMFPEHQMEDRPRAIVGFSIGRVISSIGKNLGHLMVVKLEIQKGRNDETKSKTTADTVA